MRKMTHWVASLAVLAGCLGIVACSTTPPGSDQQQLMNDSNTCYSDFTKDDPTLDKFVKDAYGYAIFPSIGKGAIGIGGAYGRGVVYQEGTAVGWTDVSQGSLGVQLGGQTYSELIVFKDKGAMFLHVFVGNYAAWIRLRKFYVLVSLIREERSSGSSFDRVLLLDFDLATVRHYRPRFKE